ncbi:uncharacterized protein [Amphiura filiformis]|uniref:uncharacterized protein n=1 Tax=Amphiura filiformis TaxID=82378 RepID=UPI003B2166A9
MLDGFQALFVSVVGQAGHPHAAEFAAKINVPWSNQRCSQHTVDPNIKFTQEGLSDNKLAFLDCLVHVKEDLSLSVSVYRKQTHTDQYLQFDSNHPLIQKLGVVTTLFHRAETIVTKESEKKAEQDHLRKALHHCGFKNWAIDKALNSGGKDGKEPTKHSSSNSGRTASATIPYHGDLSEKLKRIFREYNITTHFKLVNTIRQALVHPKDKQPKARQSGLVYGIQCAESFNCTDTYIGENHLRNGYSNINDLVRALQNQRFMHT